MSTNQRKLFTQLIKYVQLDLFTVGIVCIKHHTVKKCGRHCTLCCGGGRTFYLGI